MYVLLEHYQKTQNVNSILDDDRFNHLFKVMSACLFITRMSFLLCDYWVICGIILWDHGNILFPNSFHPIVFNPLTILTCISCYINDCKMVIEKILLFLLHLLVGILQWGGSLLLFPPSSSITMDLGIIFVQCITHYNHSSYPNCPIFS